MRKGILAFTALLVALWLFVWAWARMPAYAPLSPSERDAVMRRLRDQPGLPPARRIAGPIFVTVWDGGAPVATQILDGATLAEAFDRPALANPLLTARPDQRFSVDVLMARAPIVAAPAALFALSLVPGVDGIGVRVDQREVYVLPHELMLAGALSHWSGGDAADLVFGADADAIAGLCAKKLGLDAAAFARAPKHWFRFRVDSFVEPADAARRAVTPALPLERGKTPGPPLARESLRAGARAGGRYLLRHLYEDGRFGYEYRPARDEDVRFSLDYSLGRHAGAVDFLAALYAATRDDAFRDGAARALAFLDTRHVGHCSDGARGCIADPATGYADLGMTAMALIATADYELATGDRARTTRARRYGDFLLFMQKRDGDFRHLYSPGSDEANEKVKLLYYSGEATVGLAKLLALLGPRDPDYARYARALDDGLRYLTETQYESFITRFYYGEEHWTCIAVDAGWDALPPAHREAYARFCDGFVAFMARTQFVPGDAVVRAQPDYAGFYSLTPLLAPMGTPVGSRTEATLATYHLLQRRGLADSPAARATRRQIEVSLQFLLADQIRDDDAWMMANPDAARGGFLASAVERYVRIDFIQHDCSSMLRAAELM